MSDEKNQQRVHYKRVRKNIEDKNHKDEEIYLKLVNSSFYKMGKVFLVYVSSKDEVDTVAFIKRALADGKIVAAPRCDDAGFTMSFYKITLLDDLEKGSYGIYEPKNYCEKLIFDENSVCIVPGLSFDKNGYRIGYGKGYYDRFLSVFLGKSIGLCYFECICDKIVRNIYDKSVSEIITDKEMFHIK